MLSNARIFINIGMRIIPLEATQSLITDFTILSIRIFPEIEILGFFFHSLFFKSFAGRLMDSKGHVPSTVLLFDMFAVS